MAKMCKNLFYFELFSLALFRLQKFAKMSRPSPGWRSGPRAEPADIRRGFHSSARLSGWNRMVLLVSVLVAAEQYAFASWLKKYNRIICIYH